MEELFAKPELMVSWIAAAVGSLVGVLGIVNARALRAAQVAQEKRALALRLHEELHSPTFYKNVALPAFALWVKWRNLPEPQRGEFRDAAVGAWVGLSGRETLDRFVHERARTGDMTDIHYHLSVEDGCLTEQQALAVLLYFWARIDQLIARDLVDHETMRGLFRQSYFYVLEFCRALRAAVRERLTAGDIEPLWVPATERLEAFFGFRDVSEAEAAKDVAADSWAVRGRTMSYK